MTELQELVTMVHRNNNKGKNLSRDRVYDKFLQKQRLSLVQALKSCPAGLCDILKECIKYGVAYHHSGLTKDEKDIIERGYRSGYLFVLVATSTLSTGINLPAKAVIFRTPFIAMSYMDNARYKQMSGRAGRTGFDTHGESIMICKEF